jgi:N-acetylglucosaminyldiphosphoundecaprenol N-acetyl-beta-D-mannosaminyltransferase
LVPRWLDHLRRVEVRTTLGRPLYDTPSGATWRGMKTVSILSIEVSTATRTQLVDEVVRHLGGGASRVIGKVPSEFLVRSMREPDFRAYLTTTHLNVADGAGILWAARFLTLKTVRLAVVRELQTLWQAVYSLLSLVVSPHFCRIPIPERIRGLDAFYAMLEAAQQAKAPVYFLGARADVNEGARKRIMAKYPGLVIAGGRDGYSFDNDTVVREIDQSGAALLVVALGSPKQEYWIRDNIHRMKSVRVAVGEGGTLDLIAGDYRLAPHWMQAASLEWLWRLTMHRRNKSGGVSRARRVWNAVPVFIYYVVNWKLTNGPVRLDQQGPE